MKSYSPERNLGLLRNVCRVKGAAGDTSAMIRLDVVIRRLFWLLLAIAILSPPAIAQSLIPSDKAPSVNQLFENRTKRNTLKCYIEVKRPSVGFSLDYVIEYILDIPSSEVRVGDKLVAYVRVKPAGTEPVLLSEDFDIPSQLPAFKVREWEVDGSFALGEGNYAVELLVLDESGRSAYKHWGVSLDAWPEHAVASRLNPLTVEAIPSTFWHGYLDPRGPCAAVLLDATVPSRSNDHSWNAYLWKKDVRFLLDALPTLLAKLSPRSVRVVAFNMDQQSEVFRSENFDAAGLSDLETALRDVQSATVPNPPLDSGSKFKFLSELIREQVSSSCRQRNEVVILGPRINWDDAAPKLTMDADKTGTSRLLYFEYYGFQRFPSGETNDDFNSVHVSDTYDLPSHNAADAIEHFVLALRGTVFHIRTGGDFAVRVQSMLDQVRTNAN